MSIQQVKSTGRWQVRIKSRLLPKPLFFTFDTEAEASAYDAHAKALLKNGVVPTVLLEAAKAKVEARAVVERPMLTAVVLDYIKSAPCTDSDKDLLATVLPELRGVCIDQITFSWAENYVRSLKLDRKDARGSCNRRTGNLAPSTIRKRVEAIARVIEWHWRRNLGKGEAMPSNPLRQLPRGYSLYTDDEKQKLQSIGMEPKSDVMRDRRITPDEEKALMAALRDGCVSAAGRPVAPDPELMIFMRLVLDTGLRMKEAYSLRVEQIDFVRRFIRVEGSKGHRGASKPRTVPMRPAVVTYLKEFCKDKTGRIFSYWNGEKADRKRCSNTLTSKCGTIFRRVGMTDFTEHDMRHSACCSWFELRDAQGRWVFSDLEICKIMGWSNYSMVLRYASLRGEDLAARLDGM